MKFLKGVLQAIGGVLAMIWLAMGSVLSFAGAFGPWIFLAVLLFIIGLVLTLLGFDLAQVDLWLEAHGGTFNAIGTVLFRLFCALVLFFCVLLVALSLWTHGTRLHRKFFKAEELSVTKRKRAAADEAPLGCFGMGAVVVLGYFAFFGAFM